MSQEHAHGGSLAVYVGIFVALLTLTGITVAVSRLDLGPLNNVVMLSVAVTKATLVILFFMHLWHSPRLTWLVVATGFVWLALLIVITATDFLSVGELR